MIEVVGKEKLKKKLTTDLDKKMKTIKMNLGVFIKGTVSKMQKSINEKEGKISFFRED